MPQFRLSCINFKKEQKDFYYNNETNVLLDSSKNQVCIEDRNYPIIKEDSNYDVFSRSDLYKSKDNNKLLRLNFTGSCNYKCKYCLQAPSGKHNNDLKNFSLDKLIESIPKGPGVRRFEFWGGEPLLMWDYIYMVGKKLRSLYPDCVFYMPTNGSLITKEIAEGIDELDIGVGLSHDGPGQWQRGGQPLEGKQQANIQYLFNKRNKKNRFSFNPVLTCQNASRKAINDWFLTEVGHGDFVLGEGRLIHPTSELHYDFSLVTVSSVKKYALQSLQELRFNEVPNFMYVRACWTFFYEALFDHKPWNSIRTNCSVDKSYSMDMDLSGNISVCQNFAPDFILPSGKINKIGDIRDIDAIRLDNIVYWFEREECRNCPVVHICMGICFMTPESIRPLACNNAYGDDVGFFAAVIENITGYIPYYIEGPLKEERKDVFGVVQQGSFDPLFERTEGLLDVR